MSSGKKRAAKKTTPPQPKQVCPWCKTEMTHPLVRNFPNGNKGYRCKVCDRGFVERRA